MWFKQSYLSRGSEHFLNQFLWKLSERMFDEMYTSVCCFASYGEVFLLQFTFVASQQLRKKKKTSEEIMHNCSVYIRCYLSVQYGSTLWKTTSVLLF